MPPQPPVKTGVFTDKATGLNAVRFSPENYPEPARVRELVHNSATAKDVIHEGIAAARLETVLGGRLERLPVLYDESGKPYTNADFLFNSGNFKGKKVDFMLTDFNKEKINKFFKKNFPKMTERIIEHFEIADIVPIDYRGLDPANQNMLNSWLSGLSQNDKDKIIIIR